MRCHEFRSGIFDLSNEDDSKRWWMLSPKSERYGIGTRFFRIASGKR